MKVTVVIPNYNGSKLLEKNLPKVLAYSPNAKIIIVDDNSTDDSVTFLKKKFPQIKLIEKSKNEGFSSSVNVGVKAAETELVYLLNSDCVPGKNYLDILIPHFQDLSVFAAGSLQYESEFGSKLKHGIGVGKLEKGFLIHAKGNFDKSETLWVFGGAGMYRRSVFLELGGLYEIYNPFYWEDFDLSYRALKRGYKLIFEKNSTVVHKMHEGAIRTKYSQDDINRIAIRNQILFVWLNITDWDLLINHFIYLLYYLLKSFFTDKFFWGAFREAWGKYGEVIRLRRQNMKIEYIKDKCILTRYAKITQ